MKHVLTFFATLILNISTAYSLKAVDQSCLQSQKVTLISQMEMIHEIYGVNFVYDSSINLEIPYEGEKLPCSLKKDQESLEQCLKILFAGTGIEFKIMKRYIVLTQPDRSCL